MDIVDSEEMTEDTEAIVGAYLLFARLLGEEMNPALLEILLQPAVLEVLSKADKGAADHLKKDWRDHDFEKAAADFCDLFILPDRSVQPRAAGLPHACRLLGRGVRPEGPLVGRTE